MAEAEASERRNDGLCPWRLTDPDENGHVEFQYECGDQKVAVNLGPVAQAMDRFSAYIEQWEWRE